MNRLGFQDFHSKHFGDEQKAYWQAMLKQQQYNMSQYQFGVSEQQDYNTDQYEYNNADQYEYNNTEQYENYTDRQGYSTEQQIHNNHHQQRYEGYTQEYDNYNQTQQEHAYEEEYEEEYEYEELSKEAIEIFRFSEAYRLEREEERLKEEVNDREGMEDWQYNESTVHVSGGMEAPATSLVLTNKKEDKPSNIMIQEELLNSAYLKSCTNDDDDVPVVLWPVLPLKM